MDHTIRRANETDTSALLPLWREMMSFHAQAEPRFRPLSSPGGEQAWEKFLRNDIWGNQDWCVFVAEADGEVMGQIIGVLREQYPVFEPERFGYVMDIVVHPAARRGGVGQALFEALKVWFHDQGVHHLRLRVAHNNPVSQAFWRTMGCTDYMDILWYDLEAK